MLGGFFVLFFKALAVLCYIFPKCLALSHCDSLNYKLFYPPASTQGLGIYCKQIHPTCQIYIVLHFNGQSSVIDKTVMQSIMENI